MAEIINLRQARKRKARDAGRREGDAAAARSGRSKAERARTEAETALAARRLDGHRRDGAAGSAPTEPPSDADE